MNSSFSLLGAQISLFSAAVDLSHTELVSTLAGYVRACVCVREEVVLLRTSSGIQALE